MTTRVKVTDYEQFEDGVGVAVVIAEGLTVTIEGEPDRARLVGSISVLDPATGERLTSRDGERWARQLPSAFRTPYVRATIVDEPAL